jgi:hypothetical protein
MHAHGKISILLVFAMSALPMCALGQQLAPQPRACMPWKSDPQRELESGQVGVLLSSGIFNYSHHQYPFEALSIWGKHQTDPDKICIRYSINNPDSNMIESVVWSDAGMYFLDIPPKKWIEWIRQPSPAYPALPAQSEIKAFQNSTQTVRALLQSVPKHATFPAPQKYATSEEASLGYANFSLTQSMPDVVAALSRAGIDAEKAVVALGVGGKIEKRLGVTTQFSGDDYTFVHFSSVVPEGNVFMFEEGLKFSEFHNDIQVLSPYALSMESLKERASSQDVIRFASLIDKFRHVPLKLESGLFVRKISAPITQTPNQPALFVVEHPVTVRYNGHTMCISVTSYSPVPVQVGANYCDGTGRQ